MLRRAWSTKMRTYQPAHHSTTASLWLLLALAVVAAFAKAEYLIDSTKLQLVLIGSSDPNRMDYIKAANVTIGKFFKTYFYTDARLPHCEVCLTEAVAEKGRYYRGAWAQEIWWHYDRKWWCAQDRPIQVLQRLLPMLEHGNTLPEYLFVGDDDTWINPLQLVEQAKRLEASHIRFLGFAHPHHKYPWGGAGYFVHKSLLQALLRKPDFKLVKARILASTASHEHMASAHYTVLMGSLPEKVLLDKIFGPGLMQKQLQKLEKQLADAAAADASRSRSKAHELGAPSGTWLDICLQLKMGGRWCLWHSDWVVAECINLAAAVTPDVNGSAYGLDYNSCLPETMGNKTTCHHVTAAHYKMLYAALLGADPQLRALVQSNAASLDMNK